jgi:hypothetical protein
METFIAHIEQEEKEKEEKEEEKDKVGRMIDIIDKVDEKLGNLLMMASLMLSMDNGKKKHDDKIKRIAEYLLKSENFFQDLMSLLALDDFESSYLGVLGFKEVRKRLNSSIMCAMIINESMDDRTRNIIHNARWAPYGFWLTNDDNWYVLNVDELFIMMCCCGQNRMTIDTFNFIHTATDKFKKPEINVDQLIEFFTKEDEDFDSDYEFTYAFDLENSQGHGENNAVTDDGPSYLSPKHFWLFDASEDEFDATERIRYTDFLVRNKCYQGTISEHSISLGIYILQYYYGHSALIDHLSKFTSTTHKEFLRTCGYSIDDITHKDGYLYYVNENLGNNDYIPEEIRFKEGSSKNFIRPDEEMKLEDFDAAYKRYYGSDEEREKVRELKEIDTDEDEVYRKIKEESRQQRMDYKKNNIIKILEKRALSQREHEKKKQNPNILKIPATMMKSHISDRWLPDGIWFKQI